MKLLLAAIFIFPVLTLRHRFDGHEVWRVVPKTQKQVDALKTLWNDAYAFKLDFWKDPVSTGRPVIFRVVSERRTEIQNILHFIGLKPEVIISSVQKLVDKERTTNRLRAKGEVFDYGKYHPLEQVYAWIEEMAETYPNLVTLFNVTKSYEGRPLTAIKISTSGANGTKMGFWFNGGIHSREWISPATVIYMTSQLLAQYGKDPDITEVVDAFDWYILPVFNVDGYNYTWTTDRMWRKTRSPQADNCFGVDPNRNWDWHWCEEGASKNPCTEIYCGPSPFSEVEVREVAHFLSMNRINAFIDFHSFSQLWMTPWGFTKQLPPDFNIQDASSKVAVEALASVFGTQYEHGSIANVIYIASGSSADWTYGAAKIKYSYGVELRDKGTFGFLLPADQIIPSGQETLKALVALARFIINNP